MLSRQLQHRRAALSTHGRRQGFRADVEDEGGDVDDRVDEGPARVQSDHARGRGRALVGAGGVRAKRQAWHRRAPHGVLGGERVDPARRAAQLAVRQRPLLFRAVAPPDAPGGRGAVQRPPHVPVRRHRRVRVR